MRMFVSTNSKPHTTLPGSSGLLRQFPGRERYAYVRESSARRWRVHFPVPSLAGSLRPLVSSSIDTRGCVDPELAQKRLGKAECNILMGGRFHIVQCIAEICEDPRVM